MQSVSLLLLNISITPKSDYAMALKKPVQRSDQWHRGMMKRIKGDYTYSILPGLFILINSSECLGLIERVHRG